jgi:hypothetical protein
VAKSVYVYARFEGSDYQEGTLPAGVQRRGYCSTLFKDVFRSVCGVVLTSRDPGEAGESLYNLLISGTRSPLVVAGCIWIPVAPPWSVLRRRRGRHGQLKQSKKNRAPLRTGIPRPSPTPRPTASLFALCGGTCVDVGGDGLEVGVNSKASPKEGCTQPCCGAEA